MSTQYPIKFNKGKLVRYTKPKKYIYKFTTSRKHLDGYDDIKISDILQWIDSNGGKPEDTYLYISDDHHDYPSGEMTLSIPLSEKEIEAQEKEYQKRLKEYQEWVILSKDAIMSEEEKNRATRAKALKTQENNLLKKLQRIRKEQEKI